MRAKHALLFLGLLAAFPLKAQSQLEQKPDSIVSGFLPAISYSSDFGLFGGGIYNRINFGQNTKPFKDQFLGNVILSTKGFAQIQFYYDKTSHFGTPHRATYEVNVLRLFQNNYFGIGNAVVFDEARWNNEDYFYESRGVLLNYRGRFPVYRKKDDIKRFDVLLLGNYTYELALDRTTTSVLTQTVPYGKGSTWLSSIGTGFFWENRDNEIIPKFGNWTELNISGTIPGLSTKLSTNIMFRHHQYYTVHFIRDLTFAGRFYWRHVIGDTPFWNLSDAGFSATLRGYPYRRFIDKGAMTYNAELRTWLFDIPSWKLRFGGYFFTDIGRVFEDFADYENVFKGYHQTYGLGGTFSVFNPNFFLRMEMGYSDEISRFYAGIGYLF